jgi:hypothetical protein
MERIELSSDAYRASALAVELHCVTKVGRVGFEPTLPRLKGECLKPDLATDRVIWDLGFGISDFKCLIKEHSFVDITFQIKNFRFEFGLQKRHIRDPKSQIPNQTG